MSHGVGLLRSAPPRPVHSTASVLRSSMWGRHASFRKATHTVVVGTSLRHTWVSVISAFVSRPSRVKPTRHSVHLSLVDSRAESVGQPERYRGSETHWHSACLPTETRFQHPSRFLGIAMLRCEWKKFQKYYPKWRLFMGGNPKNPW